MGKITTILLLLITTTLFGQITPEIVNKGLETELNGNHTKNSKVDFTNIDQGLINELVAKKIRTKQLLNNPLTIFTGGKQDINKSAIKAAKHHTLYLSKIKSLQHHEGNKEFSTFTNRYKFYSGGDFGSVISKGEVCTRVNIKGNVTYNKLVNKIIKNYMKSKLHKEILLENNDKGDFLGAFITCNKNSVYNTIIFP